MENGPLVFEWVYDAPIAKVWEALTSGAAMKVWCFDVSGFEPKVGYTFTFSGGKDGKSFLHECVVTLVEPNKRLAYTWRYAGLEGNSLVTYDLSDEDGKTRIRLTHVGLETIAANGEGFQRENFTGGWTQIIGTMLKEYVER